MVTDNQVKKLRKYLQQGKTLDLAAAKSGMDVKTARKYRAPGPLPSVIKAEQVRTWRTREDPFSELWPEVQVFLELNPGLEAKTLFDHLQRTYQGRFSDGQLRTFQRKVKHWRATQGPRKEIYFPQVHKPGRLGQSDFTCLNQLGITIAGQPFKHLIYHFVLSYSNWETGTVCFSESFESLSEGLQNALWTNDIDDASRFYSKLVGYDLQSMKFGNNEIYQMVIRDGRTRAGVVKIPFSGVQPNWVPYIAVADIFAVADKVSRLGGNLFTEPDRDFSERAAVIIADPSGAVLGIQQAVPTEIGSGAKI